VLPLDFCLLIFSPFRHPCHCLCLAADRSAVSHFLVRISHTFFSTYCLSVGKCPLLPAFRILQLIVLFPSDSYSGFYTQLRATQLSFPEFFCPGYISAPLSSHLFLAHGSPWKRSAVYADLSASPRFFSRSLPVPPVVSIIMPPNSLFYSCATFFPHISVPRCLDVASCHTLMSPSLSKIPLACFCMYWRCFSACTLSLLGIFPCVGTSWL